jgi:hypothetical protein
VSGFRASVSSLADPSDPHAKERAFH